MFSELTKYEPFGTFCLSIVAEFITSAREPMSKMKKKAQIRIHIKTISHTPAVFPNFFFFFSANRSGKRKTLKEKKFISSNRCQCLQ